ncbi:unnamed protein product [Euphydryas editha]|uniref:THAP-type domain-containing protein n=1 Tax=Euphydryas editha TaxID=104508 RepID=A0AAU9U9X4_EUPED|nr:unnamed protein product [Euphydryas editha]
MNPLSGDSDVELSLVASPFCERTLLYCADIVLKTLLCLQHYNMPRLCALKCPPLGIPMHRFPDPKKYPERFKSWVTIAGGNPESVADYEYFQKKRLCDRHFTDKDRNRFNRLNALAVPSLHLTGNLARIVQKKLEKRIAIEHSYCRRLSETNVSKSSVQSKLPSLLLNKIKVTQCQVTQLKREVLRLRKRGLSLKARLTNATKLNRSVAFQKVTKNMTHPAKLFTGMQCFLTTRKPKGRRFTVEEKILSLSLYKKSVKCYSLLSKYFTLPSAKSLKRLLAEIKLQPGENKLILEKIKNTVSEMNIEDRLCTLMFDEMSITPQIHFIDQNDQLKGFAGIGKSKIANHALVFMIKGIRANYKQPVAYYFTSNMNKTELKIVIKDIIKSIQDTGLKILCTVCDQSTVNVGAINDLLSEEKARYQRRGMEYRKDVFFVQGQEIVPIYDVPHLLKGLRNNLLTKDMIYKDFNDEGKEKVFKWHYLQQLYAADKSFGELRYLHKVTEEHINRDKLKKMRVKTAAQVFSHSVAVATEHLTARNLLTEECRHLIPMTLLLDKLFDSLNSNTFHVPDGKMYKGCVKPSSPHHQLWEEAIKTLKTVKFIQKKKVGGKIQMVETTVPSVNNFIKTIEGMKALWKKLNVKYGFDAMLTRHFNQDPIENFFGNIRSYGARNTAPDAVAFEGAYKSLLLNNFNSPHSLQANCEKDDNQCLETLHFF